MMRQFQVIYLGTERTLCLIQTEKYDYVWGFYTLLKKLT